MPCVQYMKLTIIKLRRIYTVFVLRIQLLSFLKEGNGMICISKFTVDVANAAHRSYLC